MYNTTQQENVTDIHRLQLYHYLKIRGLKSVLLEPVINANEPETHGFSLNVPVQKLKLFILLYLLYSFCRGYDCTLQLFQNEIRFETQTQRADITQEQLLCMGLVKVVWVAATYLVSCRHNFHSGSLHRCTRAQ